MGSFIGLNGLDAQIALGLFEAAGCAKVGKGLNPLFSSARTGENIVDETD